MTLYANPLLDPLGASVSTTEITLDTLSQQPTRVRRMIADLSLQNFILTRLFSSPGGLSGGAAIYDLVTYNDLYPDRDLELMAPGTNVPTITSSRAAPQVAKPVEWAGRFDMTWTAMRRNDIAAFTNHARRMANAFTRKTNQYAVNLATAAISANSRQYAGHSWSTAIPPGYYGQTSTAPASSPLGDIVACQKQADVEELGVVYDTLLVNPNEHMSLLNYLGQDPDALDTALGSIGINDIVSSNRVPSGSPILTAAGQAGQVLPEVPMTTISYQEEPKRKTWWQSEASFAAFVNFPFALMQITGAA